MSERQTKAGNQITLSHSLLLSLSHSFTLTLSHSLSLDMLNNFCFHVYAQTSLTHALTLSLSLLSKISDEVFGGSLLLDRRANNFGVGPSCVGF